MTTFGVSIGALCALLILIWAFKKCVYKRMSKRSRRRLRATLKIIFVFLQVLVALPRILDMPLPPLFKDMLLYLKLPALNFVIDNLGVSCFVPTDFYWQLVTTTALPLLFIGLIFLFNLVTKLDCATALKASTGLCLLVLYGMLPVTSATIFSTFGCEDFDDGSSMLRTDYSVSCLDANYASFKQYALVMVFVWPVGVPALFGTILVSNRKVLRNAATDEHGELMRNDDRSIDRYAFFFDVYKPRCWWWEIYESVRRVACTGVLVLFPLNSVLQLNLAIFLQFQGVVMYTHFKPYEEGVENFLAVAAQAELFLTVFFALLSMLRGVEIEHGDDAHTIGAILSVGVVAITLLGLVIIVVAICKANPHEPWVRRYIPRLKLHLLYHPATTKEDLLVAVSSLTLNTTHNVS